MLYKLGTVKELRTLEGFINLDDHLEGVDLDKNNEIFATVCSLCSAYEKRAFMDAIQIGASLMLELQGN